MQQKAKAGRSLTSALASLKFGLTLLIIIAIASFFGTLIPQGEPLIYYQSVYGDTLGSFVFYTGLTHVFKSFLFITISLLLLMNLIACTCKRYQKLTTTGHWSQYGSPILHLGLVVIVIGSLVSGFLSRSDYFEVPIESTASLVEQGYSFDIKVEDFNIDYYEGHNQSAQQPPKQYRTKLTVLENNSPIDTQEIKVNQPLQYKGTKIYQSSYGWLVEGNLTTEGKCSKFSVPAGEPIPVNNNYVLQAIPATADASGENLIYRFGKEGQPHFTGKANQGEKIDTPFGSLEFTSIKPYSGLEIRQDPGVPVVWTGFLLLTAGLMIRLYGRKA